MPTWIVLLSSILCASAILGGAMYFPLIPMFFGVGKQQKESLRGKLVIALIFIFAPVSIISIYVSWTSNSYFSLLPFAYFAVLFSLRVNKNASAGPRNQYASLQENIDAKMEEIDYSWLQWSKLANAENLAIFTFYAPNNDCASKLKSNLASSKDINCSAKLSAPFKNGSFILEVEVKSVILE